MIVPSSTVSLDGQPTIAWYEMDPTTGETVGVLESGEHQALVEYNAARFAAESESKVAAFALGVITGLEVRTFQNIALFIVKVTLNQVLTIGGLGVVVAIKQLFTVASNLEAIFAAIADLPFGTSGPFAAGFLLGLTLSGSLATDPPVAGYLSDPNFHLLPPLPNVSQVNQAVPSTLPSGTFEASLSLASVQAQGQLTSSWSSASTSAFQATGLSSVSATVRDAQGNAVGSGAVSLSTPALVAVAISGQNQCNVSGQGSLSFYGPAESSLGVGGDWSSYSATVAGSVSLTLTTAALTLNGQTLPAGTYTITTNSATVTGSGATSSPNFAGAVSINAAGGTVTLGPGTGSLSVGGKPLNPQDGTTLDGYAGALSVSAKGDGTDSVSLNGNAGKVLQVSVATTTFTTDQNTPISFQPAVPTSLADTYSLTANAPPGWKVALDASGDVTVTPAPGLQSGTYPIQLIAQSQTDGNLEAQTTVQVTITPTQPGINLTVGSDPLFTVPVNGAQLPSAFRASIQNLGPAADSYNLTFAGVPSGFTIQSSGTSVTVPAGATGILGLYLVPNSGQALPAPGTVLSFQVTATSTTDKTITQTQTVMFTVPAIEAVTLSSNPTAVDAIPGATATDTITITNAGNVAVSNVALAATTSSGLTLTGLTPVALALGQSLTETVTVTPDASTPLNTLLQATITASFGAGPAAATLSLPVDVVAPGVTALAAAAVAAQQLGNTDLVDRLNDLSTALTNLVQAPTNTVYKGQAVANLTSLISDLPTDPFLAGFTPSLAAALTALTAATTASDIQAAVSSLGTALGSLATTISDEAEHGFTLLLSPDRNVVQPNAPEVFDLVIDNTGSVATTYDLSVSGLPAGVTASFSAASVTVQPGQTLGVGTGAPTLTLTESLATLIAANFTVSVVAEGAPEITKSAAGLLTLRNESILVGAFVLMPPFTSAGGKVDVSATIQATVNEPTTVSASFTVTDPSGNLLFTSANVPVALTDTTSAATVDLGTVDTTGFADGTDTITVTLSSGGSATTPLFIGQPVTGSITTTPAVIPTGTDTVSPTVTVSTQESYPVPLTLQGAVTTPAPGTSVALYQAGGKTYAYESGTGGIDDIDVTDPTNPQLLEVFGASNTNNGGLGFNIAKVVDGFLIVATTVTFNAGHFNLLVFSLTDPTNPTLVSNTSIDDQFLSDLLVNSTGTVAFVPLDGVNISGGNPATIFDHFGNFASIDLSDPTMPTLGSLLFNSTSNSGDTGLSQFGGALVNDQTVYVAGLTPGGGDVANNTGNILVVNVSDPTNMTITTQLLIPGTDSVSGAAVFGDEMLVIGTAGPSRPSLTRVRRESSTISR